MSKHKGPWQHGRQAWERLSGWHQDNPGAVPGHPDDGAAAVEALSDIGLVRRLLDQAELVAVRTARRHGKSWAEIATRLGVTRQSAWERWHDLDEEMADATRATEGTERAAETQAIERAAAAATRQAARERRRRSSVVVPDVVGMTWDEARHVLLDRGLVAVGPDPDGPPLAALGWPGGIVTDQSPESGAKVPPGSPVALWVERGGGSAGVREPRRPRPAPKPAREMREEPSDEAVG